MKLALCFVREAVFPGCVIFGYSWKDAAIAKFDQDEEDASR
jgi:hypothetical protein